MIRAKFEENDLWFFYIKTMTYFDGEVKLRLRYG